jgi:hypothetical protein
MLERIRTGETQKNASLVTDVMLKILRKLYYRELMIEKLKRGLLYSGTYKGIKKNDSRKER